MTENAYIIVIVLVVVIPLLAVILMRGKIMIKLKNIFGEIELVAEREKEQSQFTTEHLQIDGQDNEMKSVGLPNSRQIQKGGKNNRMEIK